MARSKRKPFDAAGPFVVRRRFLFNGDWTYPGAAFDSEGVDRRRVRQLWDNRQIDVGVPEIKEPKREPRAHDPERDVESRIKALQDWRSMNRVELIQYVKDVFDVTCTSKKHATEFMEEREKNL